MKLLATRVEFERRPWLAVEAKDVEVDGNVESYYSIRTHSHVVVLAVTHDGRIPLVRQFRPALEKETLELPSGLVDPGESPEAAGRRELNEETGFVAVHLLSLGRTFVDSGRMPTPQWGYFAPDVRAGDAAAGSPGEDIEVVLVAPDDFRRLIADGELAVAAQTGVVSTALARGVFSF